MTTKVVALESISSIGSLKQTEAKAAEERPQQPHRLNRFRSVRSKPTSFSSWRDNVRSACFGSQSDIDALVKGTRLWKVRRKPLQGLTCYQRKFRLDLEGLCLTYNSEASKNMLWSKKVSDGEGYCSIDLADICEVRTGFATDTFNEVEKKVDSLKISGHLRQENCFSIIFNPELNTKSLDLVAKDKRVCTNWVNALNRVINATKSIELQKEYELYLRNQFHAADDNDSGNLTVNEFAGLLQQLNIDLNAEQIRQIFDEVNTDRTPEHGDTKGEQVIDEHEFLEFYHNVLDREELNVLFKVHARLFDGHAMSAGELKDFLKLEQHMTFTDDECCQIINEFEPSQARRKRKLLSSEGFSRFFLFSDLHDIIDHSKSEQVYQVSVGAAKKRSRSVS